MMMVVVEVIIIIIIITITIISRWFDSASAVVRAVGHVIWLLTFLEQISYEVSVRQPLKKFPAFHGTQTFITVFTTARPQFPAQLRAVPVLQQFFPFMCAYAILSTLFFNIHVIWKILSARMHARNVTSVSKAPSASIFILYDVTSQKTVFS
jgi:hypothetical protein